MPPIESATDVELRIRASRRAPDAGWGAALSSDGQVVDFMSGSVKGGSLFDALEAGTQACLARLGAAVSIKVFIDDAASALAIGERALSGSAGARAHRVEAAFYHETHGPEGDAAAMLARHAMGAAAALRPDAWSSEPERQAARWLASRPRSAAATPAPQALAGRPAAAPPIAHPAPPAAAPLPKAPNALRALGASALAGLRSAWRALAGRRSDPAPQAPAAAEPGAAAPNPWASVCIHADGSFVPLGQRRMGWGAVISRLDSGHDLAGVLDVVCGGARGGSAQEAEMTAIAAALEALPAGTTRALVRTDCKNAIAPMLAAIRGQRGPHGAHGAGEAAALRRMRAAAEGLEVEIQWVKGHNGNVLNEAADILAAHGSGKDMPRHPPGMGWHPRAKATKIAKMHHAKEAKAKARAKAERLAERAQEEPRQAPPARRAARPAAPAQIHAFEAPSQARGSRRSLGGPAHLPAIARASAPRSRTRRGP